MLYRIVRLTLICGLAFAGITALVGQTRTDSDLQGVWLSNSATPLERPRALEGRAHLTDEEVAELQRRSTRLLQDGSNDFEAGDNAFLAALNNVQHYESPTSTDRNWAMVPRDFDNRTSLITGPPEESCRPSRKKPKTNEPGLRQPGTLCRDRRI